MFRHLSVVAFIAACFFAATNTMALAQSQRASVLEDIQTSVIRAIGAEARTVELAISANILTVVRVNSNMNNSTHSGRDNEATAISLVVSKAIANKPEFKDVIVIRVQYLVRVASAADRVVDSVEFRKDTNGRFQFHAT